MHLIVGLGNPGKKYINHRHNIGFKQIELIAVAKYLTFTENFSGLFAKDNTAGIILFKPMKYMNESGLAVRKIKDFFKIKAENIFIVYDDLDIEVGKIKIKIGGGNAGHNGIKSIDQHLQQSYNKIRIGISRPEENISVANHVLSDFQEYEMKKLEPVLNFIKDNIGKLLQKDFPKFLNEFYTQAQHASKK